MADGIKSDNTFQSLLPEMKDVYADKMGKIAFNPQKTKQYFNLIKKKLKEHKKKQEQF